jgi:hypothetical protein
MGMTPGSQKKQQLRCHRPWQRQRHGGSGSCGAACLQPGAAWSGHGLSLAAGATCLPKTQQSNGSRAQPGQGAAANLSQRQWLAASGCIGICGVIWPAAAAAANLLQRHLLAMAVAVFAAAVASAEVGQWRWQQICRYCRGRWQQGVIVCGCWDCSKSAAAAGSSRTGWGQKCTQAATGAFCCKKRLGSAVRTQFIHLLLLVVKIAKDIIAHCDDVGWRQQQRRRGRGRRIYHNQRGGYNNQMVALVNGSGNKLCSTKMGMVVGQSGQFQQLVTQLQRPESHENNKNRNKWYGLFCFLKSTE